MSIPITNNDCSSYLPPPDLLVESLAFTFHASPSSRFRTINGTVNRRSVCVVYSGSWSILVFSAKLAVLGLGATEARQRRALKRKKHFSRWAILTVTRPACILRQQYMTSVEPEANYWHFTAALAALPSCCRRGLLEMPAVPNATNPAPAHLARLPSACSDRLRDERDSLRSGRPGESQAPIR
jgi:hypothetical protein